MNSKKKVYTILFTAMMVALTGLVFAPGGTAMLAWGVVGAVSGISFGVYVFYRERKDALVNKQQLELSRIQRERERMMRCQEYARRYRWIQKSCREQVVQPNRSAKILSTHESVVPFVPFNKRKGRYFE